MIFVGDLMWPPLDKIEPFETWGLTHLAEKYFSLV